ncbi:MAG TPA: Ku protein, partial [Telluria sp.]
SDKELKMAMALVEGMSEEWHPEEYHDTYREDVMALVEKKVEANETKTITMPGKEKAAPSSSNVIDLVALLQQSIGKKPGKAAAANDEDEEEESEDEAPAPKAKSKAPAKTASKTAAKTATRGAAAAKPKAKAATASKAAAPARRKSA